MTTNKEIREKILIIVTDNYTDTHYYEVHEPVVDQIMQIVEEEKVEVIKAVINEINRDKYWLTGEFDLDGFLERLNDLSSLKKV